MKKMVTITAVCVLLSVSLVAYDLPQLDVLNLRSRAMGGVALAFADDQYAPVNNPAGMGLMRERYVSLIQVQLVLSGDMVEGYKYKDRFSTLLSGDYAIANDMWNYMTRLRLSVGTTPLYFALLNVLPLDFNLVVFNTFRTRLKTNPDIPVPSWDIEGYNDTVAIFNWSMNLVDFKYMNLFVGANAKLVHRVMFLENRMDLLAIKELMRFSLEDVDLMRALSFGMDLGVMAEMGHSKRFRLAFTVSDFFATKFSWTRLDPRDIWGVTLGQGGTESIEPAFNAGFCWRIGTIIPILIEDLLVGADIRNFLDKEINIFLKLYAGLEFTTLGFIKLRTGLYQGWLTGGIGIDIPLLPLEIHLSYWAEELGDFPGQERLDNFAATLNLVF